MIGILSKTNQTAAVEEFFELFKTPWEYYEPGRVYDVVVATVDVIPEINARLLLIYGAETKSNDARNGITARSRRKGESLNFETTQVPLYGDLTTFEQAGVSIACLEANSGTAGLRIGLTTDPTVVRLGYDLFQEVELLLSAGQPIEHAHVPTLDLHIDMLRHWILSEGIPLLEIPPAPKDHAFTVCLTHDIDFVGIRKHKFDHTMWGFLYRSTVGALRNLFRHRISVGRLLEMWRAAASLPFVYLGWAKDFWNPFEWYLRVEKNLPATYYLIPFKRYAGEHVPGKHPSWRATAYDVGDIRPWIATLGKEGCELGVHGIDAWHSVEQGRAERLRIAEITGESRIGIRIHWLLHDTNTAPVLDQGGYAYDSTAGYNDTIGYRSGTTQVFRPSGAKRLLELPLHIQDGALFYETRLDLSESAAEMRCKRLIENAGHFGGVLTILWHDRSHGPERFWGDFYVNLVEVLKSSDAWFATASQAVKWFQKRREVRFERAGTPDGVLVVSGNGDDQETENLPPLCLRVHRPIGEGAESFGNANRHNDTEWNAQTVVKFESVVGTVSEQPIALEARR